jgi:hypothetical protein
MAVTRADAASESLDRLYAAPFEAFVSLRRELAASLKAEGQAEAARRAASATKPTRTAWALDQIAHHKPELVKAMLGARDAAAGVQKRGQATAIREAVREYRARLTAVLHAARSVLAAAGFPVTTPQVRRMGETLAAASIEGAEARRLLEGGRLTHDMGQEDPFAGVEASPVRRREDAAPVRGDGKAAAAAAAAAAREAAARETERKALRQRMQALEAEVREARVEARRKEMAAVRAQSEADRARRAVGETEARLERAREDLRAMRA